MALEIVQLRAGRADNFSYLVWCPQTNDAMVVDPSFAPDLLLAEAEKRGLTIRILANTHGHRDHIAGNDRIMAATGAPLAAHPSDLPLAQVPLHNGQLLPLGAERIEVLHTPGHSPGSIVFRLDAAVITGDTLFVSRCGRADLPGSDVKRLYHSLQRLKQLPPETVVYPGHDYGPTPTATIAHELETNPFLLCGDLESFIELRMG
ncbi:glyoxylase-like metal-dependent hydrolase (beta-lactamase superfamily II) [Geothermobacter ehrlichii]|uniref:Glyoxylase-like metal-dependent hydrolase (Beta-lactamase superfamily II) n=1 Tax=Geothermobacter ehrlichii TaxID=213224 RepID=A0A5D3WKX0_9BACT|nr:MBL fold metallo-hydrolase [Geothermobacter ehrlichii]TYO99300.1 glyoxylase-like metal-dependent hydrolase (beta-lactamase superfamily II) [Geothermobacter ehrlichii]